MTNYSRAKGTVEKIIKELKDAGVKVKSPLSKIQDYHCEGEFSVEFQDRVPCVDATFTFDKPPKDELVNSLEAVMSKYNSYLESIKFEKDYTNVIFRVR